ncbi:MAG: hypothetical protein J3Q66DRAFT_404861 [Benniella sp.]|nr:MAG: hypothetical protein J3Q66DRAFT_404861 [Benniella sp.]
MTQESRRFRNIFRSVVRTVILALGASSVLSVHAQRFQPKCVNQASYTCIEGHGLYIQGGQVSPDENTNETFMIDLSQSWDVNKPKYKQLAPGNYTNYVPGGITADGKLWTLMDHNLVWHYNATSNSWYSFDYSFLSRTIGLIGATDHTTDMMYIPYGFLNAERQRIMWRVNLKTGETASDDRVYPMPYDIEYATAWNPLRKSVILVVRNGVFEYTWEEGWKPFFSKGLNTPPFRGSCLVSVSGGTKMALFGGTTNSNRATIGDMYVLDLTEKGKERWIKAPVTSKQRSAIARQTPACGSTGDQVIISGGNVRPGYYEFQCPKQRTLVFNVKTMKWTNRYVAPGKK